MSMRENYNANEIQSVKCEELGFYAWLGKPVYRHENFGDVTSIELIDEDYRPLQIKITTESGSVIRMFKFDTVVECMKE